MIKVEDLTIKVSYTVGLGNVQMPEEVYRQLLDAAENFKELDVTGGSRDHQEAAEWLVENIKEKDCCDWSAEVDEISDHDLVDA